MKSTASHHKEQGETFDSEKLRGRDFKLVESELDEEVADEMEDCVHISRGEMTLLKSPIHVKTVTVSKLDQDPRCIQYDWSKSLLLHYNGNDGCSRVDTRGVHHRHHRKHRH